MAEKDFYEKCRDGDYEVRLPFGKPGSPEREAHRVAYRELSTAFHTDLRAYVVSLGVPEKYADKVASYAYDEGHSGGYTEVCNAALSVAEIFSEGGK